MCVLSSSLDFKYRLRRETVTDSVPSADPTQHSCCISLSLMAEPDTAVIPLKPFEESQCPTASPATRAITIKGYYRHSSISPRAEQASDTTPVHFHALLLGYYSPAVRSLRCTSPSICPSLSMLHRLMSTHPSITTSTPFHCQNSCLLLF